MDLYVRQQTAGKPVRSSLTAAREKFSLLGQSARASDPVSRFKEAKFEATGHNWVATAAAKNLCIKCTVCFSVC